MPQKCLVVRKSWSLWDIVPEYRADRAALKRTRISRKSRLLQSILLYFKTQYLSIHTAL